MSKVDPIGPTPESPSFLAPFVITLVVIVGVLVYLTSRDTLGASQVGVYKGSRIDSCKYGKIDSIVETRYFAVDTYIDSTKHTKRDIRRELSQAEWTRLEKR